MDPDTEEMLFDKCGDKPGKYKDEMLAIMRDCMSRLETEEDRKEARELYKTWKDTETEAEQETHYNCTPGKTQEQGEPPQVTEKESAQKEEDGRASGQGCL